MFTYPKPSGGFRWVQLAAGPALVCDGLEPYAAHFFTTRPWKLGERTPDSADGWFDVARGAGVGIDHLGRLHQVHGAEAITYKKGQSGPDGSMPRADIALTDDPGIAVAIQTADCLPILIADRRTSAVAAAHAGWRGLAARAPSVAVERLVSDLASRPDDLVVAAGPAIGACCYEVGEDVRARFAQERLAAARLERWFLRAPRRLTANPPMPSLAPARRAGHWFFDAWACLCDQLVSAGVPPDQIFVAELCTASHPEPFCSYRRDGAVAGRLAAVIRPRPSPR